ncbi:MAG: efflux RND transporter periplasmic adaptor subunit [bacterium]|nr:efflux RND transporter periplasmic adaptor subunit [bacterium]
MTIGTEKTIMTTRKLFAAAALMLAPALLSIAGCGPKGGAAPPAETARNVRVLELDATDLDEMFEVSGAVQPLRGTDVAAEEGGTVAVIARDKGARVAKGQTLIELDRRLLAAEADAARADLALQAYNVEQTQRLFDAGKVSRVELLTAEAQHGRSAAAARVAELRHERAAVAAPYAGIVAERFVEPGQLVAPGTVVARVVDPSVLKLAGWLTERDIVWLREGAAAEVSLDGVAAPVAGRVAWLGFEADPVTGKFPLEIRLDNQDLSLRPGVVGRARIHKQTLAGVIAIPRDAVLDAGGGAAVYVVEGDRAQLRRIVLGPDQGLLVAVTAGLRAGELLVVRGQRDLIDGALVKTVETANARDGSLAGDPSATTEAGAATRDAAPATEAAR